MCSRLGVYVHVCCIYYVYTCVRAWTDVYTCANVCYVDVHVCTWGYADPWSTRVASK